MPAFILLSLLALCVSNVSAQPLLVTHTFANNEVADAEQVNQNFDDIEDWVNEVIVVDEKINMGIGVDALASNTDAYFNTAIGWQTLFSNTDGNWNIAIGPYALYANTEGLNNIAVGYAALLSNEMASSNIAIGLDALNSNTAGAGNVSALSTNLASLYSFLIAHC